MQIRAIPKLCLALMASVHLSACGALYTTNAAVPTDHITVSKDIAYAELPEHKLDIYQPKNNTAQPRPVIVFFYGGSWQSGDKDDYLFLGESLVDAGYVVVTPDYRKYPQVKSPAFLQDAAKAILWTKNNIARYGGDTNNIFISGHSAGAHIAVLSVLDKRYLAEVGLNDDFIAGVIGLSGPYDFKPTVTKPIAATFGPPSRFPESQPINYARGDAPPLLLIHGRKDHTVAVKNAINLHAAMQRAGGKSELVVYPDDDHVDPLMGLTRLVRTWSSSRKDLIQFVEQQR